MTIEDLVFYGESCFGRSWQAQLADNLDIDRRTVGSWIRRENVPSWADSEIKSLVIKRFNEISNAYKSINSLNID